MEAKQDIKNRDDIELLVRSFYGKIRKDPMLGHIFNSIIDDWEDHFILLTDFWETQLFLKRKYNGNPVAVHQQVDEIMEHSIGPEHFGQWINIWFATLEELFEGETAWIARNRAQKMSTMLYLQMYQNRQKNK